MLNNEFIWGQFERKMLPGPQGTRGAPKKCQRSPQDPEIRIAGGDSGTPLLDSCNPLLYKGGPFWGGEEGAGRSDSPFGSSLTESSIVICLSSLVVSEELRTCGSERVYSAGAERERLNCQLELN